MKHLLMMEHPKKPTGTISVNAGTVNVSDLEVLYKGTGSTTL